MKKLHYIFCKVNADGNKIFTLLETHNFFRFQYRLLSMTTFFEIAVYTHNKHTYRTHAHTHLSKDTLRSIAFCYQDVLPTPPSNPFKTKNRNAIHDNSQLFRIIKVHLLFKAHANGHNKCQQLPLCWVLLANNVVSVCMGLKV